MKSFLFILVILLGAATSYAAKPLADCIAKEVYDTSTFEESFSVEEYPEVYVTESEAWIGASLFKKSEKTMIASKRVSDEHQLIFIGEIRAPSMFTILIDLRTMEGQLFETIDGTNKQFLLADLACNE